MGACQSVQPRNSIVLNSDYENYKGAGVCFKNDTHILAGVQTIKKERMISGFGGKREKSDESYYYTAFREMIEELFEAKATNDAIYKCIFHFKPKEIKYFEKNSYVMFIYDMGDLEKMLYELKKCKIITYAYKQFPTKINELLFERIKMNSEIRSICLVPLDTNKYDPWFIEDLHTFQS